MFSNFSVIMFPTLIVERYKISTKHSHDLTFAFPGRVKEFIVRNGFWFT